MSAETTNGSNGERASLRDVMRLGERLEDKFDAFAESFSAKIDSVKAELKAEIAPVKVDVGKLKGWKNKMTAVVGFLAFCVSPALTILLFVTHSPKVHP